MRREAKTSADIAVAEDEVLNRGHFGQSRHVAGRLFREIQSTWTDLRHETSQRTVRVESFSPAYFAVLQALPELEPYLKAFDRVVVAGERVSVLVGPDGDRELSERALARIVREFRGN